MARRPLPPAPAIRTDGAVGAAHDAPQRMAASYGRSAVYDPETVDAQHRANAAQARNDGYELPEPLRFSDVGVAGTGAAQAELERLFAVVTAGTSGVRRLYVRDPERLTRRADPRWLYWFELKLEAFGVEICHTSHLVTTPAVRPGARA